ncbi:phage tail tape measure protein [Kineothrix sedimenti]|uniref:Phage tail tape measure protein n=1 Tax=Kineothrix sedimenti TaxID=3123317 RepID=A0ABZ3F2W6_9FIRM
MTTWLSKLKTELPEVSEETKKTLSEIQKSVNESLDIGISPDFTDGFVGELEIADDSLKKFLKTWDGTGDVTEKYNQYLKSASDSSSTFSANLKKVSATLKSVAANMAIMLAINVAVQTLSKVWDNLNVTVEEQRDKVDSLKASYEELNSEYDSLKEKDSLSSYEKDRLSYLERRLDLDKQILEIEQKQLYKEQIGTGNWTDAFDEDSLLNKKSRELNTRPDADNLAGVSTRSTKEIEKYLGLSEKLRDLVKEQSELEEGRTAKSEYLERRMAFIQEKEANSLKELQEYQDELVIKQGEYLENAQTAQEAVDSGLLTGKDLASAQEMADYWNQMYQDALGIQFSIQKATNTYNPGEKNGLVRRASNKFGNISDSDMGTFSEEDLKLILELDVDPDSITSVEDLKAKVEELKLGVEETNETPLSIGSVSSLIDQLNSQLKPAFDSLQKAYQNIFTEDGFSPENVDLSMLKDIKSAIEEINEIDGIDIDLSSFDDLAKVLTNPATTATKAQSAFDTFAASIINGTNAIDGMDESTAQLVTSMLESLGVANAEEVVMAKLTSQVEGLALEKQFAAQTGKELVTATSDEVLAFLNHAGASETARQYLFKLISAEQVFGDTDLSVEDKISKLKELATAYGQTAIAARIANLEKANKDGHVPINYNDELASLQKEINDSVNNVKIDFASVGSGSAGSAGKEAADKYIEAFEDELSELNRLKDIGILSEKSYLDSLRKLYLKYYAKKEKYLKEYQEQEKNYLQGMKSLYESAFSYITKQIDKRIDSIQKQSDAQIASMEAQKKAAEEFYQNQIDELDEQIDAIDKEISAKQELIDAINEAADARQREIDLQKAQYDLERMQNQNTQLVYKDGQMAYEADTSGIREAREEVESKKRDIEIATIEKVIDGLEKQRDVLEEQQEALEKALDASNAYWDAEIEKIEKHFDSMILNLEETKSKFTELSEVFENAQMEATLQELGINMEVLLSGSSEEFDKLKNSYVGILADMSRSNDEVVGKLSQLSGVSAESVSYLESTKGAFENLGATTLDPLSTDVEETATSVEGLSTSAGEASTAVGDIGTNASNTTASITPLNDEIQKLKDLLDELTTLFGKLEFPTPGEEGYAQKLEAIATAFGNIATKCKEFEQINFSSIIGTGGEDIQSTGFTGLGTAISNAVIIIETQMDKLKTALQTGNDAFKDQVSYITDTYVPAWESLQTRLGEIIGVGGGGTSKENKDTTTTSNTKPKTESAGDGSIVDIMQTGGDEVSAKLQDPWLTSFNEFATGENSIQSIANLIKDIVTEMATSIQSQCEAAAKAIKDLADTALNSSISIGGHGGGSSKPSNAKAYAKGSDGLPRNEKNALVGEVAPELVVDPETGQYSIFTTPTITDLKKGSIVYDGDETKKILSGKGIASNNAYAEGTASRSNIVPIDYTAPGNENLRKFMEYMERNTNALDIVATMKNPLSDIADSVNSISNVVNNSTNNMRNVEVSVGDIYLQGVQDTNSLSSAIIERLPNTLAQELHRR